MNSKTNYVFCNFRSNRSFAICETVLKKAPEGLIWEALKNKRVCMHWWERPACSPKTKLVLLSADGPAHLPMKFGMHSGRQGFGKVHRSVALKLLKKIPRNRRNREIHSHWSSWWIRWSSDSAGTLSLKGWHHYSICVWCSETPEGGDISIANVFCVQKPPKGVTLL